MKISDVAVETQRWLRQPLCRRYAVVVFSTISKVSIKTDPDVSRTISWALGTLLNGDREVLGVWYSDAGSALPPTVFGELYHRGAEYITCGLGDLAGVRDAFKAVYPRGVLLPSVEQLLAAALVLVKPRHRSVLASLLRANMADPADEPRTVLPSETSNADCRARYPELLKQWDEAIAGFRPLFALPELYGHLARSVDRTAMEVQQRLMRAIQRHGPFADAMEAFDFVAGALQRADRRLYREVNREAKAAPLARDTFGPCFVRPAPGRGGAVGTAPSA